MSSRPTAGRAPDNEILALIIVSATGQKNVGQKNEEGQTHSSFFCLTFFCPVGFGGRNDDQSRNFQHNQSPLISLMSGKTA